MRPAAEGEVGLISIKRHAKVDYWHSKTKTKTKTQAEGHGWWWIGRETDAATH